MLSGLFRRFVVLLFKTHGKTAAVNALRTCMDVADDVLGGVFATDELLDEPCLLVVNTDPTSRLGRHMCGKGRSWRVFRLVRETIHCVFRTVHGQTLLVVDV